MPRRPATHDPGSLPRGPALGQSRAYGAVAAVLVLVGLTGAGAYLLRAQAPTAAAPARRLEDIPFPGAKAFEYLETLCRLGPRPSGSPAMRQQQDLLATHFQRLGAKVERQTFAVRHPQTGQAVEMTNLIVSWHPDRAERLLLCAHYDTRPFPDRDPRNPRGRFVGANDGASGTALLMALGASMGKLPGPLGVDFVLFDGEELVYRETDPYFLGSTWFARWYAAGQCPWRYRAGVLLDMVADRDLRIDQDPISLQYARPVMAQVWEAARRLGVGEFTGRVGRPVRDDHVPLNEIARIPTIDLIDFDYPYWHTEADVPENCSPLSLAKVGWVVEEWLREQTAAAAGGGQAGGGRR